MKQRLKGTIVLAGMVIAILATERFLPSYLETESQGVLTAKAALLPVVFVAFSMLAGALAGLWVGKQ